ncbi:TonB-dependent siderophore receptor [Sphingomonas sp. Marseille-Q8236]
MKVSGMLRSGMRVVLPQTLLLATTGAAAMVMASAAAAQTTRRYDIPAGNLADVLNRYAQQAGVELAYPAELTTGRTSPGLKGSFALAEGLSHILTGSGLSFRQTGERAFTLEAAPQVANGTIQLGPVRVEGRGESASIPLGSTTSDPGTTEASRSYASPVTTTALRMPTTLKETPQSVTIITRQRIEDQNLTEITQALAQTVGVTFNASGSPDSDSSVLYSRGFAVSNWQVDGIARPTAYGFGDSYADLAIYDRAELIRGASGLLNGSGNPAATVNLVRKRATAQTQILLEGQGGSWSYGRGQIDIGGPVDGDGRVRARFVGAYQGGGLNIDRATTHRNVLYATAETELTDTTMLRVGIDYLRRQADQSNMNGVPIITTDGKPTRFARSRNTVTDWTRYDRDSLSAFASLEQRVGAWSLRLDVDRTQKNYDMVFGYALDGALNPDGSGIGIYPGRWAATQRMATVIGTASGPLKIFSDDDLLMVGATHYQTKEDGPAYKNWDYPDTAIANYYTWQGKGPAEPDWVYRGETGNKERQTAAFGTLRLKPVSPLSLIAGGRITNWLRDTWNVRVTGTRTTSRIEEKGQFTPYAGLVLDVTRQVSLYASYTDIFQPQDYRDVQGRFLDPLVGKGYELGAKAALNDGKLNLSAAWFRIQQSNFAVYVPGVVGPTGDYVYKALDGTRSEGVELEASGEILPGWQVSGGYSHVEPKDRDGVRLNANLPSDSVKLLTSYDAGKAGIHGLNVGGNLLWNSSSYTDISGWVSGQTRATQPAYAVVDAFVRYALTPQLSLSVNASNLFDKRYYSNMDWFATFGEARRIVGTLRARF